LQTLTTRSLVINKHEENPFYATQYIPYFK
jgi:hypothetical protein